ncbi:type I restriction-modification system subunit M [Alcanivorax sp. 1008]|uniref:type I restriction-modification system subunit M n=1 Tax=Alcanivorax sp. 1008 TaxID=2816853 RepID=UPI001DB26D15|nr:type I restriction-modification system subunit M [Alcanivorax sp. 1008]MCC1498001.1 N-6 DNA methylase [Alcanivorax sp. 1008]
MITGQLKSKVDKLWLEFFSSGIANPLTVIEQITFLMFARLLDINESRDEKRKARTKKEFKPRFSAEEQHLRWSSFSHIGDADELMAVVRDGVFKHFRTHGSDSRFGEYMKDARLVIEKPSLLVKAVEMINELPLEAGDTKGDLYEYLLSKLNTAGINGQFRTPRHIIRLMVEMLDPQPDEKIADPSVGTAGFLVTTMDYLLEHNTSKEGVIEEQVTDEQGNELVEKIYTGDMLTQADWEHVRTSMFHGFDFDATMLRVAAMNLYMHGVEDPDIFYQDALAQSFGDRFPQYEQDAFNVVLANPPFKGMIDEDTINPPILRMVKTKKTELLFLAQILRMLKMGGRSATIVPQGVLFGSSRAHQSVREELIERNQLEAVINLPSGVFKPYAGVATAILIFAKGGQTDHVWFYDMLDDGFSLDDKRDPLYKDEAGRPVSFAGDLPKVLAAWKARDKRAADGDENDRSAASFWVGKKELASNKYDLSLSRYKEVKYEEEEYDPPKVILTRLKGLEKEIMADIDELEKML